MVTDQRGRVFYVNRAYADLTGAATGAEVKTVEQLLADSPEAASVVARLSAGICATARAEKAKRGLPRRSGQGRSPARAGTGSARGRSRCPDHRQPLAAWELADVSHEREEQERFFLDLQKAIDHLDQAPAGFFATDQSGRVTYMNATLAGWLGVDLAGFTPGSIRLQDIVAGDGMALVRSVKAEPGSTRNAVFDLDLSTSSGKALPVRFMHRVSASKGGVGGPSRTIVLNRTQGEDASAELRAAEVRFTRFFNSTPMAIAGVDREGRIVRTNAPFLSLFSSIVDSDARQPPDQAGHSRPRA